MRRARLLHPFKVRDERLRRQPLKPAYTHRACRMVARHVGKYHNKASGGAWIGDVVACQGAEGRVCLFGRILCQSTLEWICVVVHMAVAWVGVR